jgi:hypothetical protein
MLRILILFLLLANGAFWAWSQGMLQAYGLAPQQHSEPQRLNQQIQPHAMVLLTEKEIQKLEEEARLQDPVQCLQAGLFDEAQTLVLRAALASGLPAASWHLDPSQAPGRWIIYIGKLATPDLVAKKQAQLQARKMRSELVSTGPLAPGLSLGAFDSEAAAQAELAALAARGLKTARVEMELAPVQGFVVRLAAVNVDVRQRLPALKEVLAGREWVTCAPA